MVDNKKSKNKKHKRATDQVAPPQSKRRRRAPTQQPRSRADVPTAAAAAATASYASSSDSEPDTKVKATSQHVGIEAIVAANSVSPNAEAAAAAEGDNVAKFPECVPMENEFDDTYYYVRECYPQYYAEVMELLSNKQWDPKKPGVIVTGTPGIGKSVFMGYFFERYCADHKKTTVFMSSFDTERLFIKAVVTKGGERCGPDLYDWKDLINATLAAQSTKNAGVGGIDEDGKNVIWLLDGPPKTIPVNNVPWVAFSKPNEVWKKTLSKNTGRIKEILMPIWTLKELQIAALALGRLDLFDRTDDDQLRELRFDNVVATNSAEDDELKVLKELEASETPRVLNYRFSVFGGVPRVCFLGDRERLRMIFELLKAAVDSTTLNEIIAAMKHEQRKVLVHRIIHYVPNGFGGKKLKVASVELERYIARRQQDILKEDQALLEGMLQNSPGARSMLGHIIETRLHRQLESGCSGKAKKLGVSGDESFNIAIAKPSKIPRITNTFQIVGFDACQPQVVLPFSTNLQSIDGLYWIPKNGPHSCRVLLFQVTASLKHSVKGLGIVKALKALRVWEDVAASPHTTVALVFVVPQVEQANFKAQKITTTPGFTEGSTVGRISGIKGERMKGLAKLKIHTVGELRKSIKTDSAVVRAKKLLEAHEESESAVTEGSEEERVLKQIPQYVWGI